jgi:hypothetical protein
VKVEPRSKLSSATLGASSSTPARISSAAQSKSALSKLPEGESSDAVLLSISCFSESEASRKSASSQRKPSANAAIASASLDQRKSARDQFDQAAPRKSAQSNMMSGAPSIAVLLSLISAVARRH